MRKTIYSPEQEVLCRLLREARHKGGLRQVDVAERLGRPQSYVAKYESGERRLDVIELRAVCQATGTTLQAFVRKLEKSIEQGNA